MQSVMVKIIKCDEPLAWYANLVGEEFECYLLHWAWVLKEDYDRGGAYPWCNISFDDGQIRAVEHRNGADTGQDTDKDVSADV